MRPERKKKADKTSAAISFAVHAAVVGGITYWAAKSGKLDPVLKWMDLVAAKKEEKQKEEPKPPEPTQTQPQPNVPPPPGGPARSATVSAAPPGAPPAMGGTFFTAPKRPPGQGITGGGVVGGTGTNAAPTAPTVAAPKAAPAPAPGPNMVAAAPAPTKLPPPPPPLSVVKPTTIAAVLEERKKAAAVTDAIGSEQISKGTSSDAGDIVSKVTGTTIVEGKFVVVRGLADRYTSTTLNGADIPSADPYRKSVQLDLFPAAIIDNIVVAKTFTPDLPGAFTGGAVNIVTKSIPSRYFFKLSLGASYNTQSSFNNAFPTYDGGAFDWAALDDGSLALPPEFENPNLVIPGIAFPRTTARNAELTRLTRALGPVQFGPVNGSSPLNNSFSLSTGDQFYFLGMPAGYFMGMSYNRSFSSYEGGERNRFRNSGGALQPSVELKDKRGVMEASWVTSVSLGLKPVEGHEFAFNFLYNQFAEDTARLSDGDVIDTAGTRIQAEQNELLFVERHLHTFQLKGSHELPRHNEPRFDWLATLSETTQAEPDSRFLNAFKMPGPGGTTIYSINSNEIPQPILPTRYFRDLLDENFNLKGDFAWPFLQWAGLDSEFKAGGYFSASKREFTERTFQYKMSGPFGDVSDFTGTPNTFLTDEVLQFSSGTLTRYLVNDIGNSRYSGQQDITAAYMMTDLAVAERLRLIGGARMELTDLSIAGTGGSVLGSANSSLQAAHWLPSLNLVYNLATDMNIRLAWAQTIARPSYREIANYQAYDPSIDTLVRGNPALQISTVDNYDVRWEWFPRPGEVLSVSGFYKKIQNPIERKFTDIQGDILIYENRDQATVYGIELEARKKLDFLSPHLDNFSWGFSYSMLKSEVKLTAAELATKRLGVPDAKQTRPLYDQSPYIFSTDLNYDNKRTGTSMTLGYSVVGPRLTIASALINDVYEQPAPQLDFVWSQRLRPGMSLKFTAKNLLDPVYRRTYGDKNLPQNSYSAYTKGMTFGISLSYEY